MQMGMDPTLHPTLHHMGMDPTLHPTLHHMGMDPTLHPTLYLALHPTSLRYGAPLPQHSFSFVSVSLSPPTAFSPHLEPTHCIQLTP